MRTSRKPSLGRRIAALLLFAFAAAATAHAGLEAYWTFDEGSGGTATDSVNGNVGTLQNGAQFSASVPSAIGTGSSLLLDGVNDYVNVPDSPSVSLMGTMTLSAWINAPSFAGTSRNILAKDSNNAYRWRCNGNSGELWTLLNDGAGYELFSAGVAAPTGGWNHVAVSADFSDSTMRFYVGGGLVATKPITAKTKIADTGGVLCIGAYNTSGAEGFNGNIDDVSIWTHRLDDSEIQMLANGVRPTAFPLKIVNPSFEIDAFPGWPGYTSSSGNPGITGWTSSAPGNTGINPMTDGRSPFADTGTIPDGTQVAFIQGGGRTLSQTLTGLEPGTSYIVTYRENARNSGDDPNGAVSLGGQTIVGSHLVTPVGGANPYRYVGSAVHTATAEAEILSFANTSGGGDRTLLIDDVAIHRAHLLFRDNFNALGNSYTINPSGNDEPGRQAGLCRPLNYTERVGTSDYETQVDNVQYPDALLIANGPGHSIISVSPDANFRQVHPTDGAHFVIEYQVDPCNPAGGSTINPGDWAAVIFGSTSQTPHVNQSDGIGFLIRENGGYQVFDGTGTGNVLRAGGDLGDQFGIDETGWYDVRVNYFVSAFDDTTQGDVALFVDDILIASFPTTGGFANNFIALEGYGGPNLTTHGFDNFAVYSTYIPEPASLSLLALGGLGLLIRRRRRH